jgi:hypothetical protein
VFRGAPAGQHRDARGAHGCPEVVDDEVVELVVLVLVGLVVVVVVEVVGVVVVDVLVGV